MGIETAAISYPELLEEAKGSGMPVAEYLRQLLPDLWIDAYREMTPRRTEICDFTYGTFDYIYDDVQTLEKMGLVPPDPTMEARLVAAIGTSRPTAARRDDFRLRGWVGPTGKMFGPEWDKGHFIAHSIGGAVDGVEANVFLQRRALNRGWSKAGKQYRAMEKYCQENPGVLCFSRPIYSDASSVPEQIEFGILRTDGTLWVQIFVNR